MVRSGQPEGMGYPEASGCVLARCACTSSHGGHLGSLFVWSRPQPHIVHPFFSSRLDVHVFLFFKPAFVLWEQVATACEHSELKPWLVIGLLRCGFALFDLQT